MLVGFLGQEFAAAGALGGVDLRRRKNEAMLGGIVGFSLGLTHFHNVQEGVQVLLLLGSAGFLELAELRHSSFELAGQALAVHAQVG
ncbi:MAG: hypothetical protein ABSF12_13110 [Bryobacteraceae bacterium]